jgi:hypothetical protein
VLDTPFGAVVTPSVTFLSVTEAGMYQVRVSVPRVPRRAAARWATRSGARGGRAVAAERTSPHVARRLILARPDGCRTSASTDVEAALGGQNWYEQTLE